MAIRRVQALCYWDSDVSDTLKYVLKARHLAAWHLLLFTEALATTANLRGCSTPWSTLEDHPCPLTPPKFLQSLPSRVVHWRSRREVKLVVWGVRLAYQLSVGAQLSGLRLQSDSLAGQTSKGPCCPLVCLKGLPGTAHTRRCFAYYPQMP